MTDNNVVNVAIPIGAVLRSVQASALRGGTAAPSAFLDGYHAGLYVTIGIIAICVVVSYITLRPRTTAVSPSPAPLADAPSPART